jgi:hypothetical protein
MRWMNHGEAIWLVHNQASGSNDDAALAGLLSALSEAGFRVAKRTVFPDEPGPDAAALERAGIEAVCVFAGDGTLHTVVTGLFGWSGRIVVVPGGTMNLLSQRLHGQEDAAGIVARIGAGEGFVTRPPILEARHGFALTGALAGPGAEWNNAREAMRNKAVGELVVTAAGAASESLSGDRAVCRGLEHVRPEGYPAISITPQADGILVEGYYADGVGDYLAQLASIVKGDFRDGPHDTLGSFAKVELASLGGQPLSLLMDGEPYDGAPAETFHLTRCKVDLVATAPRA